MSYRNELEAATARVVMLEEQLDEIGRSSNTRLETVADERDRLRRRLRELEGELERLRHSEIPPPLAERQRDDRVVAAGGRSVASVIAAGIVFVALIAMYAGSCRFR